jgi:hypothetical protein
MPLQENQTFIAKTIEAKLRVTQFLAVALLGSCTAKLDKLLDIENIIYVVLFYL